MNRHTIALMATGLALSITGPAIAIDCQKKLVPTGGAPGDLVGWSVSIDGETALVGSFVGGPYSQGPGKAYVFRNNGLTWGNGQELTVDEWWEWGLFGFDVALEGGLAVVGAPEAMGNVWSGAAYVFVRDGSSWQYEHALAPSDDITSAYFGCSVGLSGNTIVVGAITGRDDAFVVTGSAFFYEFDGVSWNETAKVVAPDRAALDGFGGFVAIDGSTAVIGSPQDDDLGEDSGSAYVYVGTVDWSYHTKLLAPDGAAEDAFGRAVDVDGDWLVVGAPSHDGGAPSMGAAYVYHRSGSTWSYAQTLEPSSPDEEQWFGRSVAIDGGLMIVGASGGAGSLYVYSLVGQSWQQQRVLTAYDGAPGDRLGISAALSGPLAVVGAIGENTNGEESGAAYVMVAEECVETCIFDVNLDGLVGINEFLWILGHWGQCDSPCAGDLDGDGYITIIDLLMVLADWGPCQ